MKDLIIKLECGGLLDILYHHIYFWISGYGDEVQDDYELSKSLKDK